MPLADKSTVPGQYQQLYFQDAAGNMLPLPPQTLASGVQGPAVLAPSYAPQFTMGPGSEWMLLPPPMPYQHQVPAKSWRNGTEICLLVTGGIMIMLNVLFIAYAVMMRIVLKEMKGFVVS